MWQWFTALFIGLICLIVVVYDLLALYFGGADATISSVINVWAFQAHPLIVFMLGFVVGGLVIHFLGWRPTLPTE